MSFAIRAVSLRYDHGAEFRLGETSGVPGHVPLAGEFEVMHLADGTFTCTGPMFKGFNMKLGPMAVLRRGNVRVVLASMGMKIEVNNFTPSRMGIRASSFR